MEVNFNNKIVFSFSFSSFLVSFLVDENHINHNMQIEISREREIFRFFQ